MIITLLKKIFAKNNSPETSHPLDAPSKIVEIQAEIKEAKKPQPPLEKPKVSKAMENAKQRSPSKKSVKNNFQKRNKK